MYIQMDTLRAWKIKKVEIYMEKGRKILKLNSILSIVNLFSFFFLLNLMGMQTTHICIHNSIQYMYRGYTKVKWKLNFKRGEYWRNWKKFFFYQHNEKSVLKDDVDEKWCDDLNSPFWILYFIIFSKDSFIDILNLLTLDDLKYYIFIQLLWGSYFSDSLEI